MPSKPTWWTVLDAMPAWWPMVWVGPWQRLLGRHHDNADALSRGAVIDGLRAWYRKGKNDKDVSCKVLCALLIGTDADLIATALAVAALEKEKA